MSPLIYLIGSLRNPHIPAIANALQSATNILVFADWHGAGEYADDCWKAYEEARGFDYLAALARPAARNVFEFDRTFLMQASHVVLAMPAGRSGFLELGWSLGRGVPGYILLAEDWQRWDVMTQFATGLGRTVDEIARMIRPAAMGV